MYQLIWKKIVKTFFKFIIKRYIKLCVGLQESGCFFVVGTIAIKFLCLKVDVAPYKNN